MAGAGQGTRARWGDLEDTCSRRGRWCETAVITPLVKGGLATAAPIGDAMVVPVMPVEAPRGTVAEDVATSMGGHEALAMPAFGIAHLVRVLRHALGLG